MRSFRWMVVSLAGVVGCATSSFLSYRMAPDYPRTDRARTDVIGGLEGPVEVLHDRFGVAHVRAGSEKDLMRAIGFLHGRDRFFQMDLLRRLAAGRVSELVGEQPFLSGTTVTFDLAMRGWGFEEAARADEEGEGPEEQALLAAYADGVNQAMRRWRPLEYRLLRVEPEPWTPRDTFLVARLVAWSVTHNWHQEASRLILFLHLGLERGLKAFGTDPWPGSASLPATTRPGALPPAVVPEVEEILRGAMAPGATAAASGVPPVAWPSGASNAWVVGGGRSASGFPILANDPHMTHMLPSLMYPQHIAAPGLDAIGATVPGLPYLLSGHNARVAWGLTSTVADTVDLCIEKPDPADPGRVLGPRGPERIRQERVVVRVRDGDAVQDRAFSVRRTRNGPAFNDLYPGLLPAGAPLVTIRWEVGPLSGGVEALGRANRAGSVLELMEAMSGLVAPVQTVTAADVEGRVALFAVGRVPARRHHSGAFPIPGWDARYDWDGFIPFEEMPHAVGGRDDVFIHANNLMTEPAPPYFIQVDSAPPYRFDRIRDLLAATERHTVDSMAAIQTDVVLLRARLHVPQMLEDLDGISEDGKSAEASAGTLARCVDLLRAWDLAATADSAAAAIFFATYREAAVLALSDEVGPAGLDFILSQRYSTNAVDSWFLDTGHPVWDRRDTPQVENRRDMVREAFRRAVEGIARVQGADPLTWRWGRMHDLAVRHPFGGRKALAGLVNLPESEAAGGLDSVWKSHFDLGREEHPFRAMAGPVWRMVVDLGDPAHARFVLDTGVSGWPGSPHYRDLHDLWKRGETAPLLSDWDEVRREAVGVWSLLPRGE